MKAFFALVAAAALVAAQDTPALPDCAVSFVP